MQNSGGGDESSFWDTLSVKSPESPNQRFLEAEMERPEGEKFWRQMRVPFGTYECEISGSHPSRGV